MSTSGDGSYSTILPSNTYTLSVDAGGYLSKSYTGIAIKESTETIIDFSLESVPNGPLYFQNETIPTGIYESNISIMTGDNVTSTKATGLVTIESGANVTLKSKTILVKPGVHVKQGSKFHAIGQ